MEVSTSSLDFNFKIINAGVGSKFFVDVDGKTPKFDAPVFQCSRSNMTATYWPKEEVKKLIATINKLHLNSNEGPNAVVDWDRVSCCMKNKSPIDCLIQYRNVACPDLNFSKWTWEEESQLIKLASKHDLHDWVSVAEELGTRRTPIECLKHYQVDWTLIASYLLN